MKKKKLKRIGCSAIFLACLAFIIVDPLVSIRALVDVVPVTKLDGPYKILYVVDGDTIAISVNGEREYVRLLQINTPERGERGAAKATDTLERLIALGRYTGLHRRIYLEYSGSRRDRYNRRLAYVWCGGRNLNLELVARGVAEPMFDYGKGPYYQELVKISQ